MIVGGVGMAWRIGRRVSYGRGQAGGCEDDRPRGARSADGEIEQGILLHVNTCYWSLEGARGVWRRMGTHLGVVVYNSVGRPAGPAGSSKAMRQPEDTRMCHEPETGPVDRIAVPAPAVSSSSPADSHSLAAL